MINPDAKTGGKSSRRRASNTDPGTGTGTGTGTSTGVELSQLFVLCYLLIRLPPQT